MLLLDGAALSQTITLLKIIWTITKCKRYFFHLEVHQLNRMKIKCCVSFDLFSYVRLRILKVLSSAMPFIADTLNKYNMSIETYDLPLLEFFTFFSPSEITKIDIS